MFIDEPESWNHFAIDLLDRSLLEQSATIIALLEKKKKMTQLVDNNFIVVQFPVGIKFSTSLALHRG